MSFTATLIPNIYNKLPEIFEYLLNEILHSTHEFPIQCFGSRLLSLLTPGAECYVTKRLEQFLVDSRSGSFKNERFLSEIIHAA